MISSFMRSSDGLKGRDWESLGDPKPFQKGEPLFDPAKIRQPAKKPAAAPPR